MSDNLKKKISRAEKLLEKIELLEKENRDLKIRLEKNQNDSDKEYKDLETELKNTRERLDQITSNPDFIKAFPYQNNNLFK